MPYYCTVPQCTSMSGKIKNVSFHQFPRDKELANLWNTILKRGKPYTKYSKVCSLHFKPEDFKGVWKTLKRDAIPSKNLPTVTPRQSFNIEENGEMVDTKMQQQLAAAIYSQSMLAMQAAALMMNASKCDESSSSAEDAKSSNSFTSDSPHLLPNPLQITEENIEFIKNLLSNGHGIIENMRQSRQLRTFTCSRCLKHYKDYDVYLLHKRTHKDESDTEKENVIANQEVLRANPILANLLTSTEDNNTDSEEENSLVANMKIYLNNLAAAMVKESHVFNVKTEETMKKECDDAAGEDCERTNIDQ
ncbi:uncharacterized protein LOC121727209 [Aricia agestis]|uniref:uncharacterized protein LOC121727209 n=1 Tax=Aricia agestis TaxID=91739 RepID=UPI001C206492|nr:uncharacterized protein LOC121727209 [Aricia agestis]XP_041970848.1 uncharacterized protein LOC121727209 [Aricia agestis]